MNLKTRQEILRAAEAAVAEHEARNEIRPGMIALDLNTGVYERRRYAIDALITYDKEDDIITLGFAYPYEIELERIRSPLALLEWVDHLMEKDRMKKEYLRAFLRKVCQIKKWNLHRGV
jgi:hypothetical protein